MFITKKHLSRRSILRGMGVGLALPFLDAMVPAGTAFAQTAAAPKLRMGFLYIPHGAVLSAWTPIGEGRDFKFNRTLMPLEPFRENIVVVSGLSNKAASPSGPGDGGGDHGRSPATWLTGVHPKRTEGEDVRAAVTIDQMAALKIGQETQLPSLELATEDTTGLVGACDVGYSCTYINTLCWRTPTTPLPMEINPRVVFESLFGEGSNQAERTLRMHREQSILDTVSSQVKRLQGDLSSSDKTRVNDYLDNVREIERRIQLAEKKTGETDLSLPETPLGVPDSHEEHSKLQFDLMALAFQADITRVSTFMMARELSSRTFGNIGVPDPFHATSHHQNDKEKLEKLTKINEYHVGLVAYFLNKLKNTQDGDGSLLDHTLLMYGSCMSNSNVHDHGPLPVFLAGGANGQLKGGRHVKFPYETPWPICCYRCWIKRACIRIGSAIPRAVWRKSKRTKP
jgi:hypothetical protein